MHFVLMIGFFLCLLPVNAGAQDGIGPLDFIGKRENRPAAQPLLRHPAGGGATCFTLPGNSCNDTDCRTDRERAQLVQAKADNMAGAAYRYSFSVYLTSDFIDVAPANLILWEVKPPGTGKPSAVVEIIDEHLQFSLSNPGVTQTDKMKPERPMIIQRLGAIPRGRWTEITLDVKWSQGADGAMRLYHNGRQVVSHRGPNIDANSKRQQIFYGLYRSFISRYLVSRGAARMPSQQACFANVLRQRINM